MRTLGKTKQAKVNEFEAIFSTTLKRYEAIEKLLRNTVKKKKTFTYDFAKERLYKISDSAENIIKEMYYKRVIEPKLIKRLYYEYIDRNHLQITDLNDLINMENNDYLWIDAGNNCFAFDDTELFALVLKTWKTITNEIEKYNYKLF